jgi:hypothetical protein
MYPVSAPLISGGVAAAGAAAGAAGAVAAAVEDSCPQAETGSNSAPTTISPAADNDRKRLLMVVTLRPDSGASTIRRFPAKSVNKLREQLAPQYDVSSPRGRAWEDHVFF